MDAIYKIEVDPVNNILRQYLAGFFEPADVERFVADRNAAFGQLTCGPNQHLALVDARHVKIQQQDVVQAFQAVLANPPLRSRKLAFVVSHSLACKQLQRAASGRDARFFYSVAEAEAWLLGRDGVLPRLAKSNAPEWHMPWKRGVQGLMTDA
jgi:hypothetical protein